MMPLFPPFRKDALKDSFCTVKRLKVKCCLYAAVFLDMRRAFDTVWHIGRICKLSRYVHGPFMSIQ